MKLVKLQSVDHYMYITVYYFDQISHITCTLNIFFRVTMDEAKEVHTSLRTAAGIFKFVKVLNISDHSKLYRGYYTVARRYKFYVRVARTKSQE